MAAFCASRVAVPVVSAKGGVVSKQVRAGSGACVRGLSVDKATRHTAIGFDFPPPPSGSARPAHRR